MDAAERALFADGIRLATAGADGAALDAALDALGWADALEADEATAVSLLFESQGTATASSSALDRLLASALGVESAGIADVGVVLPPLRETDPPGQWVHGHCVVDGLSTAALAQCGSLLVVAGNADGDAGATLLAVEPAQLQRRPVEGLDPDLGLSLVTGSFEQSSVVAAVDWPVVVALGQLALGHQLVGTGRAMLELARTHALERVQFGQAIAGFQAVRHRLAETLVALEAAAALLDAAWEERSVVTAAMAKAFAGRSARTAARHCQQVLAGIGFTTEHPFHRSLRRTLVLDQLLGAGNDLTRQLGADVLTRATLPAAFSL
jgi:hypothetical protein